ncbi:D-amino-acid oxidase [Galleria mellonella]|uniref:D-amino-acid oxidase n=1 Tax=Galleria mellonella TaxID=7137 RepID=A0A6J1WAJ1_GALME|nr:D-amino-acid oxidase [Galleria mellonella]
MVKIAVIGGGINGFSSAVKIKEKFKDAQVVLFSDEFSPNTTGDGSGGLWYPYLCSNTPEHLLIKWGIETYQFVHGLWRKGGHDINLMPMYSLYKNKERFIRPKWASMVFGYHELEEKQLRYLGELYSSAYSAGETFSTFVLLPPSMIKYMETRFKNANGNVINARVGSLHDVILRDYDVIINCTGLGSRDMVPDDAVFPIRGQIAKVVAPWVNQTIMDDDRENYIIPNVNMCVLGGTHQEHDYNRQVDEKDKEMILNGCQAILPSLKNAQLVNHWVGLRPGRSEIRLEPEVIDGKLYIHNYGHGGSGFTLFWGCATNVVDLLEKYLNKSQSKL